MANNKRINYSYVEIYFINVKQRRKFKTLPILDNLNYEYLIFLLFRMLFFFFFNNVSKVTKINIGAIKT